MQQGTRGREPVAQAAHVGPRERLQSIADQNPLAWRLRRQGWPSKREVWMSLLWVYIGFAAGVLMLVLLLARAVGNSQRRRIAARQRRYR